MVKKHLKFQKKKTFALLKNIKNFSKTLTNGKIKPLQNVHNSQNQHKHSYWYFYSQSLIKQYEVPFENETVASLQKEKYDRKK